MADNNPLTERELEIVAYTADGHTTAGTARKLGLSPETVKSHKRNILRKTDSRSMSQVVAKALYLGWFN